MRFHAENCCLCPRRCGADRKKSVGRCHCGEQILVTRADLHPWEEPCISGETGSGTVFFAGCALGCVFCQNHEISRRAVGKPLTVRQLADIFLRLQEQHACNINLVTGSHYTPWIVEALSLVKSELMIPVVWNSGGYDSLEILEMLNGWVDIYLPDLKFYSPKTAKNLSSCSNYFSVASSAILKMFHQVGGLVWNENCLQRGLVVRHLVLPGYRKESIALIDWLARSLPTDQFLFSLMGQYTPTEEVQGDKYLRRFVTTLEYESVREYAVQLGMRGYSQDRSSASEAFLPDFFMDSKNF